ncbi:MULTISPECIES: PepSY domain-containing protein [unclassified Nonomuraea]|uniref:PepSY domain-containing protein n=1 Tax=unclassified Nonomuraea TaxID=2593643 RepID=UPI0033D511D8
MNGGKRFKPIVGVLFLFAAGACGSAPIQTSAVETAPAGGAAPALMSPGDPSGDSAQESGGIGSLEKAVAAATNAVEGTKVLSVQSENGGQIWEVQLARPDGTEQLMEVDASGNVVSKPRSKDTGKGEKARVMGIIEDAELSFEDVVKKVSSAVPHGKITHISLDRYTGKILVWDVDVLTPDGAWHGLKIDARTGTVSRTG